MTTKKDAAPLLGRGEIEWLVSGVGTVLLGGLFRHLRLEDVSTAQLMLLRYCGQIGLGLIAGVVMTRGLGFLKLKHPVHIVARGVAVFVAATCVVNAQGLLPVTTQIGVGFMWPVLLIVWVSFRGEPVTRVNWIQLALCLLGVFVESGMTLESMSSPGMLWMMGAVVANAANVQLGRHVLELGESPLTSVSWTGFVGLAGVMLWWGLQPSSFGAMPTDVGSLLPVMVVLLAGIVQILQTTAMGHATAAKLMPLTYAQLLWAVPLDIIAFGHYPSAAAILGLGFIVVGVVLPNLLDWMRPKSER